MRVVAEAPAKLNLYLAVGARAPDGYHHVDTVLVALDLCDTVIVEPAAASDADVRAGRRRPRPRTTWPGGPRSPSVKRSAEHGRRRSPCRKRMPAGAGLGGGSADAAAVLAALARAVGRCAPDDPLLERHGRSRRGGRAVLPAGRMRAVRRTGRPLRARPARARRCVRARQPGRRPCRPMRRTPPSTGCRPPRPGPALVDATALRRRDAEALGAALFNNMTEASVRAGTRDARRASIDARVSGCLGSDDGGERVDRLRRVRGERGRRRRGRARAGAVWWATVGASRAPTARSPRRRRESARDDHEGRRGHPRGRRRRGHRPDLPVQGARPRRRQAAGRVGRRRLPGGASSSTRSPS